jgi:hypothetical protein
MEEIVSSVKRDRHHVREISLARTNTANRSTAVGEMMEATQTKCRHGRTSQQRSGRAAERSADAS